MGCYIHSLADHRAAYEAWTQYAAVVVDFSQLCTVDLPVPERPDPCSVNCGDLKGVPRFPLVKLVKLAAKLGLTDPCMRVRTPTPRLSSSATCSEVQF